MSMGSDTAHDADTLRIHHDAREQHIHVTGIKAMVMASQAYGRGHVANEPRRPRVYVSGPMTGLPALNFPAFIAAALQLRGMGFDAVNPAELNPDPGKPWAECMRVDIKALMDCDGVALLDGWEESKGACIEAELAGTLGLDVRLLCYWLNADQPEQDSQRGEDGRDQGSARRNAVFQERSMIAALYVEPAGCYIELPDVSPWPEARDARTYDGPHPVVAHPPCQRWGRFWHGSTRKPHQYQLGDDGGCFEAALRAVLRWGGVLEHPAHSKAWDAFGLLKPTIGKGWQRSDMGHPSSGYWVCYVEQGHYGHTSRKPTWLLANTYSRPQELNWTKGEQRLPEWMVERYGYEKARRIGVVAMVGGKNKTAIRNATPPAFRDVLLSIARSAAVGAAGAGRG